MISYRYIKHTLQFNFEARTSRGEIKTHDAYIIIAHDKLTNRFGLGEAAPLSGLSIDSTPDFEIKLQEILLQLNEGVSISNIELQKFPSIQFALEAAHLNLQFETKAHYFHNNWMDSQAIPINGLVWMSESKSMLKEALEKAEKGFDCIKFKIGALDFDEECRMLEQFRKSFSDSKVQIRLDANGAFLPDDALLKLKELNRFVIHSIEQPIKQNQWEAMQELIAKSPINIALDEELIGVDVFTEGKKLMEFLKPHYLILKPSLIGGLKTAEEWIRWTEYFNKSWWATSALESNIGLNIIAQWCSTKNNKMHQGLGTGSLYKNNFDAPFLVENGYLFYIPSQSWKLPLDWFN
ncbi:MAG: o-succinylbenzoate synthase [Bacteroidia bacterium]